VPPPDPLVVTPLAARRFFRRALGLDVPHCDIGAALAHHGYIQIDPINICGRMHDLILRSRVAGYSEGDLGQYLHGDDLSSSGRAAALASASRAPAPLAAEARVAFEHHVPGTGILVAFPLEAWPHLLGAMRTWSLGRGAWAGRLTPREKILADHLLAEIRARGPLGSEDFDDDRQARKVWGAAKLVKATLQKLFFHGRLLIAQRFNNRRRYDLPERVLPRALLAQPEPPRHETARWLALLKLRQRRLVTLKREELRLVADTVQSVTVAGCPPLFCLQSDVPLLIEASSRGEETEQAGSSQRGTRPSAAELKPVHLLAPLDPLIYDRRITAALWNFEYTWEAYTPPLKRVRGYYALPVLVGTEIVGHVDLKADRAQRKLIVVSRRVRRGHSVAPVLGEFAQWLRLRAR
jgi:uncharacterized protein YcaQ